MNKFLNEMTRAGILTDKERFVEELKKCNLVINKETVEAIGYDGEIESVPIDTEDMFVCCTCSRYCTSGYDGSCDTCNRCRCARCARGDAVHPCTTEIEEDLISCSEHSSSESDKHKHFYELDMTAQQHYPFIGFRKQNMVQHSMPCSFRKLV